MNEPEHFFWMVMESLIELITSENYFYRYVGIALSVFLPFLILFAIIEAGIVSIVEFLSHKEVVLEDRSKQSSAHEKVRIEKRKSISYLIVFYR